MPDLSVLVVEDNALARAALLRLLTAHSDIGAVIEAASLAEARQQIASKGLDLVFLDVCLPDGKGTQFGSELAERAKAPALVYLTADPGAAVEAFRQGRSTIYSSPSQRPISRAPWDACVSHGMAGRLRRLRSAMGPRRVSLQPNLSRRWKVQAIISAFMQEVRCIWCVSPSLRCSRASDLGSSVSTARSSCAPAWSPQWRQSVTAMVSWSWLAANGFGSADLTVATSMRRWARGDRFTTAAPQLTS